VKIVNCKTDLFQVVCALHSSCRLTGGLNSGQKQSNQHPNNRYHHKKLNKSKTKKRQMFFGRVIRIV
jgi:hypothetical protein